MYFIKSYSLSLPRFGLLCALPPPKLGHHDLPFPPRRCYLYYQPILLTTCRRIVLEQLSLIDTFLLRLWHRCLQAKLISLGLQTLQNLTQIHLSEHLTTPSQEGLPPDHHVRAASVPPLSLALGWVWNALSNASPYLKSVPPSGSGSSVTST